MVDKIEKYKYPYSDGCPKCGAKSDCKYNNENNTYEFFERAYCRFCRLCVYCCSCKKTDAIVNFSIKPIKGILNEKHKKITIKSDNKDKIKSKLEKLKQKLADLGG